MTTPTNLLEIPEELIEQWNLDWIYQNKCVGSITSYMAKRGAEWAVQQTAEECAKVCENQQLGMGFICEDADNAQIATFYGWESGRDDCAKAIRTKYQPVEQEKK